jgi:adenylate cyclase
MKSDVRRREEMVALNADVVGYSRLLADDYEATTSVMNEYRHLVESSVAERGGTVANFVGDSFMAVFDDAKDGVGAAVSLATEIEARNAGVAPSRQVRFRMGLDLGEVGVTEGQYHGDALNIAARIQALAPPGGLGISGGVYRALDEPALRFRPVGRQQLKNIPEEVEVYEFADLPMEGKVPSEHRLLSLESPTLAVLPIHAESAGDSVRMAADIVRSDLLHRLARVPQLRIIDAGVAPGHPVETSARYLLESGVHQLGDQIRVYTTLIDVTTMNVVKSLKWVVGEADLLALSDDLADELARAVEIELVVGEPAGLYGELDDPVAIESVYLGWYHLTAGTREGWARALELFDVVAQSHPHQPYGHALMAFTNWLGASNDWVPDSGATLEKAGEQAQVALGLGDPTGVAQSVAAAVLMSQGRVEEALAATDEIKVTRPTCDVTFGLEASVRRYLGQWERAVDLADVAMRLTGVNKPWYPTVKACSLFMGGRLEQAASLAEMVLDFQPNNLEALLVLAAAQVELGLHRRARATADLIRERFPAVDVESWIERNPYTNPERVDRWKSDLSSVGLIPAV